MLSDLGPARQARPTGGLPVMSLLVENLQAVGARIAAAAQRSGRTAADVTLVAVTKSIAAGTIRPLAAAGCLDFGESRPQELWSKAESLADLPIRWHFIGHLQRNRVEGTLAVATRIHSVDGLRLLAAIDAAAAALNRRVSVLLEINISGDSAKHGFMPAEMPQRVREAAAYSHVQIRGLMGMAGIMGGIERARRDFRALREVRDQLRGLNVAGLTLDELSMGMSDDFEVAVEEGATIVRVGSALFAGVGP